MGSRHKSRECALKILYALDVGSGEVDESLRLFWATQPEAQDAKEFGEGLVRGFSEHQKTIDSEIEKYSMHWKLHRIAAVDRNILRLAVYELMFCADIPKSVTLNEAIELGKNYGAEESGAFVNGVLDRIAQEVKK